MSENKRFYFTDSIRRNILYLFIGFRLTSFSNRETWNFEPRCGEQANIDFVFSRLIVFPCGVLKYFFLNGLFHFRKRKRCWPIQLLNWIQWRLRSLFSPNWDTSRANTKWQFINIGHGVFKCQCTLYSKHSMFDGSICDQMDVNIYFKPINCITWTLPSLQSLSMSSSTTLGYPIKWQWRRNIHIFNVVLICLPVTAREFAAQNQMFVSFDNPCDLVGAERARGAKKM